MKSGFGFNQIALAALLVAGGVALSAIFSGYTGLIELQCSSGGCRVVLDSRR